MSTPNFEFMKYGMPLIIAETPCYDDMKEQYEEDTGEEYDEDIYCMDCQFIAEDMQNLADEINDTLEYFTVEVQDGYYSDLQFIVNQVYENMFDLDKDSKYCIDNEDAHYYFGECRSKVLRKADAEKRRIYKWLKSMKNLGYIELNCDGVFSNGEAIYSIVK